MSRRSQRRWYERTSSIPGMYRIRVDDDRRSPETARATAALAATLPAPIGAAGSKADALSAHWLPGATAVATEPTVLDVTQEMRQARKPA